MANKKLPTGLGKGIGALMPDANLGKDSKGMIIASAEQAKPVENIQKISLDKIVPNKFQPRNVFDEEALEELTQSIKENGIITPISVRKTKDGFELISGERRFRASQKAGLTEIPAYIMDIVTDEQMLELAIIENVQREDLNPIEIGDSYQRLIDECGLTHEEVSQKIGKKRSTVTNYLRILSLPNKVKDMLISQSISLGHAKVLLTLQNAEQINSLADDVIDFNLSVRDTEKRIKDIQSGKKEVFEPKVKFQLSQENLAMVDSFENKLRQQYGTEVKLKFKNEQTGHIEINFYSQDDLERILELINSNS